VLCERQKDALVNEYKGNIFEYLWARSCLESLDLSYTQLVVDDSLMEMFLIQENFLRHERPRLLTSLHLWAQESVAFILSDLVPYFKNSETKIYILGKKGGNFTQDLWQKIPHESDVLLVNESKKKIQSISLKLALAKSYVNCKSSGLQSFLEKYFSFAPEIIHFFQGNLNFHLDQYFEEFRLGLHENHQLEDLGGFRSWINNHQSLLPGELQQEDKKILNQLYENLGEIVYKTLEELYTLNRDLFFQGIFRLLGFDHESESSSFFQLIAFTPSENLVNQSLVDILKVDENVLKKNDPLLQAISFSRRGGNTLLHLPWGQMAFRIKPMNTFSSPGFKLNIAFQWHLNKEFLT
jgi:hypothetical protein